MLLLQQGMMTISVCWKYSYFSNSQSYASIFLVTTIHCQGKVFLKGSVHSLNKCRFSQKSVGVADTAFSYFR